ncbi:RNA-directed DNA polymerase from mobile element jockey-like [Brachionus plicatilis]|uniref:RNA-directed DNA polymerase from mobile element jockey-like n=1 Tax=Brachionus plicatilis TaxID=10195 RepID=A0A3M7R9M7_BRAPC|nr:RNA-directed DNA polymerase from mobile element jockey-like [Brachionus plicatilis]
MTNSVLAENQARESKKESLVVFGLKQESNIDVAEQVRNLFQAIGVNTNNIEHVRRFRQTNSKSVPPIFIHLKKGVDRNGVLAEAKKLRKTEGYAGVYICPDRTECERRLDKQLNERWEVLNKEEESKNEGRHYRWVIRGNELRRIKQTSTNTADKGVVDLFLARTMKFLGRLY